MRTLRTLALMVLSLAPAAALQADQAGDRALAEARQEAAERIAGAEAEAAAAQELQRHPDYVEATRRDPEIVSIARQAKRYLDLSRTSFEKAETRPTQNAYKDAGILASGASREFVKLDDRARAVLQQIDSERPKPPPPPDPQPPPPPPPPPGPPRTLSRAADAFFGGDYDTVVTLTSETRFRSRQARAHAYLLRAAARYHLFLLGGETDYALRGKAIEDVLACRGADPSLTPAENAFSPRFRELFAATE